MISVDTGLILLITLKNPLIWIVFVLIEDRIMAGGAFRERKFELSDHGSLGWGHN